MKSRKTVVSEVTVLGIECGGTRTVAISATANGQLVKRVEAGPANLRLLKDAELQKLFSEIAQPIAVPSAIGFGMAGAREAADRARVTRIAAKVWPGVPTVVTHDLETALRAVETTKKHAGLARVVILSGTGSCCYGQTSGGKAVKLGGWGHLIGDKGSGYELGLRALKATVYHYDRDQKWTDLGQRILASQQLNEPNDLIAWAQAASKTEIAALAVQVFNSWEKGDRIAKDILTGAANSLARDGAACAQRLVKSGVPVQFVLAGSVLLKQPRFAQMVAREVRQLWPGAIVTPLQRESAWGAVVLAQALLTTAQKQQPLLTSVQAEETPRQPLPTAMSPTEQRNPRSLKLDQLPIREAIELILDEDQQLPAAIRAEADKIEQVVKFIERAFRRGGRLIYVGAGTSGRLGVLDASECPPTFRTPPEMVQGIIAGGQRAIWQAVEGAEDDAAAGARAIEFRGITKNDVVVGIAASGRTPFVWGALREAKRRGAKTAFVCFNHLLEVSPKEKPDVFIAPKIGPEILTGSTRLKSGTATKLILNIFTTLAMVRIGKVISNLMVDVNPSNIKLRDRAVRIVRDLTEVDYATAHMALEQNGWIVKAAWQALQPRRKGK